MSKPSPRRYCSRRGQAKPADSAGSAMPPEFRQAAPERSARTSPQGSYPCPSGRAVRPRCRCSRRRCPGRPLVKLLPQRQQLQEDICAFEHTPYRACLAAPQPTAFGKVSQFHGEASTWTATVTIMPHPVVTSVMPLNSLRLCSNRIGNAIETRRELVRLIGQGISCGGSHFQRRLRHGPSSHPASAFFSIGRQSSPDRLPATGPRRWQCS